MKKIYKIFSTNCYVFIHNNKLPELGKTLVYQANHRYTRTFALCRFEKYNTNNKNKQTIKNDIFDTNNAA